MIKADARRLRCEHNDLGVDLTGCSIGLAGLWSCDRLCCILVSLTAFIEGKKMAGLFATDTVDVGSLRGLLDSQGAVRIRTSPSADLSRFVDLTDDLMRSITHHATGTDERDVVSNEGTVSTVNKRARRHPSAS